MFSNLRPALVMVALFSLLTGAVYPALITGLAQTLFPYQANGSMIVQQGRTVGSALLGQGFAQDKYFHGRPSAAGNGYDPTNSGGSNLAPTSQALSDRMKADISTWSALHPGAVVPADLLTTSASGLDPHISPEAAEFQVDRVAAARKLDPQRLRELVNAHTEARELGFLGEPVVNVLALNLALDRLQ